MSLQDLKSLFRRVLADHIAGPVASKELLAFQDRAITASRPGAKRECGSIVLDARNALDEVEMEAIEMKGMASVDIFPARMKQFLPRVRALAKKGSLVEGPALAWSALLEVASCAIYELDGGDAEVQEGEDTCDWSHDQVDDVMVEICQLQKKSNPDWFSDQQRYVEIKALQEEAHGGCAYRYQRALALLKTGKVHVRPQAPRKQLASKAARKSAPGNAAPARLLVVLDESDAESSGSSLSGNEEGG